MAGTLSSIVFQFPWEVAYIGGLIGDRECATWRNFLALRRGLSCSSCSSSPASPKGNERELQTLEDDLGRKSSST
jgi:hypothetical protein